MRRNLAAGRLRVRSTRRYVNSRTRGTTIVEMAVILPVFLSFLFALFEFSHAYMVVNTINAAAKKAARYGVAEGISTQQVAARTEEILEQAFDTNAVTVLIKDAGVFDTPGTDPSSIDYQNLSNIELNDAEPRQLFLIRVEIPYDEVAIIPPFWIKGATLTGQSVMRHE